VYALCSSMVPLDFSTEPSFECGDDDFRDLAFVRTTGLIGMHVHTMNLGMHVHVISIRLYKIAHIYFLLKIIVML
jgi:hypothetical protein